MNIEPLKVLVVDDDLDVADSMASLLEMDGHKTEIVLRAKEVLNVARRVLPDIVLMDVGMPEMNGYEVATLIRREPLLNRTLLVALTGWGGEVDKREAMEAGFDVHLLKPVRHSALQEVVARFVP
jgi:CheY-like chemotaxis protein